MVVKIVVSAFTSLLVTTMVLVFFIFFKNNTFDIKCIAMGGVPNHNFQSNICFRPESIIEVK